MSSPRLAMAFLVVLFPMVTSPVAYAGADAAAVRSAVADFVEAEDITAAEAAELRVEAEALTAARAADVGIVLLSIYLLVLIGRGLKNDVAPTLSPAVFASCMIGVLWFTVVDPSFYEFKAVDVTADGITVETYTGDPQTIAWADVSTVTVRDGSAFPVFSDDRALVLRAGEGEDAPAVAVPAFVPRRADVAAQILGRLAP